MVRGGERVCRVLYIGVRDPGYPRNARIRRYLEETYGAQVVLLPTVVEGSRWSRYPRQLWRLLRTRGPFDVVILAEMANYLFWLSWFAARRHRALHLVDFYIGLHETRIGDWKQAAAGSPRARLLWLADRLTLLSADLVVTDTRVRAERLSRAAPGRTVRSLPVGAPPGTHSPPPSTSSERLASDGQVASGEPLVPPGGRPSADRLRILYYGNYLPLHGVDLLVDALAGLPPKVGYSLTLVGDGELRPALERRARERLRPGSYRFLPPQPWEALREQIHQHDVIAGIFGESEKARSVIANKVWQGLYAGKHVVTQHCRALDEIAGLAGDALHQVRPGSVESLREALAGLGRSRSAPAAGPLAARLEDYVLDEFHRVFRAPAIAGRLAG